MKSGCAIQELAQEIRRQGEVKHDYVVDTRCLHMDVWDGQPFLRALNDDGADLVEPLDIQTTAHRQISTYLNIPIKYYERMRLEDPELLACNVNRWFQRIPSERRMLRTLDGHARAFLSSRYRRIDNLDVARITIPVVGELPGIQYRRLLLRSGYRFRCS